MNNAPKLADIEPEAASTVPSTALVLGGIPIPPVRLLQVMSLKDWLEGE